MRFQSLRREAGDARRVEGFIAAALSSEKDAKANQENQLHRGFRV